MSLDLPAARAIRAATAARFSVVQRRSSAWKRGLGLFVGLCLEFNILVGGGGEGASATGGYGYRLIDFVALGAACLLAIHALAPRRILPLAVYGLVAAVMFATPALSTDPRTAILAYHYMLYSLAALYVAIVIDDVAALEWFCWGLIVGLLAILPIFFIQDSVYASKLVEWGLAPGYASAMGGIGWEAFRYSGLSGHPNEAGHVAALSAAAGAYFGLVRRRFMPVIVVFLGLMVVFYYTWSRGGLIAGGAILAIPFLVARGRVSISRLALTCVILLVVVAVMSQLDFVAFRFTGDPNANNNVSDRMDSILAGLQVLLANPLGLPIDDFLSRVASDSGGVGSPHDGFIFFAGIFGLAPLALLLLAFASCLRIRDKVDVFFALFVAQISLSFMFEILPGSYPYAFVLCLVGARAFIRTPIGCELKIGAVHSGRRSALDFRPRN